ncbi:MAG: chemotaxis protein CheB [Candidatus Heimdallarchaeota archaeon]|nr:chemotaxis protein CheB [Candidatus Heimdallarchaeota archaeon]
MPIRVLVADKGRDVDVIARACELDHAIKVIARAKSSLDVISYSSKAQIDVIVTTTRIDNNFDRIISRIMEKKPIPMLILQDSYDTTLYGQEYDIGIIDKLLVNYNKAGLVINEVSMITRIQILSRVKLDRIIEKLERDKKKPRRSFDFRKRKPVDKIEPKSLIAPMPKSNKIVVIGASTGGPRLLSKIIPYFPINLPPIIIVQHIPVGFIEGFAKRMARVSQIKVKIAEHNEIIQKGTIYVAPGGKHLRLNDRGTMMPRIDIFDDKPINFVKPAVDVTLFSAVEIYKKDVISVILTGMGIDGLKGSQEVKKYGGKVLALNKEDSDIYGMNRAVIEAGIVDKILPATGIVKGIVDALRDR